MSTKTTGYIHRTRDYEYGSSWQQEGQAIALRETIYQTMEYVRPVRPSSAKNVDTFVPKRITSNYAGFESDASGASSRQTSSNMRQTRVSVAPVNRRTTSNGPNRVRPASGEAFSTQQRFTRQDRDALFAEQARRILDARFSDSD